MLTGTAACPLLSLNDLQNNNRLQLRGIVNGGFALAGEWWPCGYSNQNFDGVNVKHAQYQNQTRG